MHWATLPACIEIFQDRCLDRRPRCGVVIHQILGPNHLPPLRGHQENDDDANNHLRDALA